MHETCIGTPEYLFKNVLTMYKDNTTIQEIFMDLALQVIGYN
jgi:hypothetical protein